MVESSSPDPMAQIWTIFFSLRPLLFVWNTFLAVFSILGTWRFGIEFFHTLTERYDFFVISKMNDFYRELWMDFRRKDAIVNFFRPFTDSICFSVDPKGPAAFWACMFALSKIAEFGDTLFLVLKKRPVIFLHWYHHAVVLIYCWHSGNGNFCYRFVWFQPLLDNLIRYTQLSRYKSVVCTC